MIGVSRFAHKHRPGYPYEIFESVLLHGCTFLKPGPEWRRDFCAGRANSVKARARDSGDLRSALTEFAPALRCHYPGQAVSLETDSETYVVLRLWLFGDFLLRCHRLPVGDFCYMRAPP